MEIAIFGFFLTILGISWFAGSDAPYVPTTNNKLMEALKAAGVKKGKNFFELGSGDGRVVIESAKMGSDSSGIEQSWMRVLYSKYTAYKLKLKNCHFYHGNMFNRRYKGTDIAYIFMLPKAVARLEQKLPAEMPKGSIIITQRYHFKKIKPFKKIDEFWIYKI